ncbi:hypothetical protein [Streptomyces sp. NK15101]|uniref:hypothetical protein n=1 Tax=Streptomyces sp. NK15101 TaxID=2873261 RepID=UPI001CED5E51|nr:hypothetical protein [Streptomyces sp. NK15101]
MLWGVNPYPPSTTETRLAAPTVVFAAAWIAASRRAPRRTGLPVRTPPRPGVLLELLLLLLLPTALGRRAARPTGGRPGPACGLPVLRDAGDRAGAGLALVINTSGPSLPDLA